MKTIKILITILSLSVMNQFAGAQNCPGVKVRMSTGSKGHGCTCKSKCVDTSEVATYQANYWYIGECLKFCWAGWRSEDQMNRSEESSFTSVHPNPASGSVTILFSLAQSEKVSLKLYDMTGRLVTTLEEKPFEEGENEFVWNASVVNAGIYFLRMETAGYSEDHKLIVAK